MSRKDEWRDGFVNEYFQIIEAVADTNFFTYWKRLEENNRQIADGETGEFGRTIELNLIEAEVPVHYLLNFSQGPHGRGGQPGRRGRARVVPRQQHPAAAGRARAAAADDAARRR